MQACTTTETKKNQKIQLGEARSKYRWAMPDPRRAIAKPRLMEFKIPVNKREKAAIGSGAVQ
jgi:hypothetical protein